MGISWDWQGVTARPEAPIPASVLNQRMKALSQFTKHVPRYAVLSGERGVVAPSYEWFDVRRYGGRGNGVFDDTTALQNMAAAAQVYHAAAYIPEGQWRYTARLANLTARCSIIGAGIGKTWLVPDSGYAGWMLSIEECHRTNAQGDADATTLGDLDDYTPFVELSGFSLSGDRANVAYGIKTIGRVDLLRMTDIGFFGLNGTALQLGREDAVGAGKGGVVRESEFSRLRIEHCGSEDDNAPALDITTSATATDGTNQLSFNQLKCVYNNWTTVLLECLNTTASCNTRRITFTDFMLHGVHGITGGDPACDLMQITGAVTDVKLLGLKSNNSNTVAGTNYAAIRWGSNASGSPDAIVIDGDVRAMGGDAYVIDAAAGTTIRGTAGCQSPSLELKVNAAPAELRYDVMSQQGAAVRPGLLSVVSEAAAFAVQGAFADRYEATAADGDATPDVFCVGALITGNSSATTITDLDNGRCLQTVVILANDANTTIQNGANIKTKTGANVVMVSGQTITLWHQASTLWREI